MALQNGLKPFVYRLFIAKLDGAVYNGFIILGPRIYEGAVMAAKRP